MRSALAAVALAVFVVLALTRANFARAEPPPPMEQRELSKVVEALKGDAALKPQLAAVRFYGEVLGGTTIRAPVGSPLTTLGPWGDNEALLSAEALIEGKGCGPPGAAELKAAGALLTQFGPALSPALRGYTLLHQGKLDEAADIFGKLIDGALPEAGCPGEHPMYSGRRVARMTMALHCLERAAPGKSRAAYEKRLEKARSCVKNNHAVG